MIFLTFYKQKKGSVLDNTLFLLPLTLCFASPLFFAGRERYMSVRKGQLSLRELFLSGLSVIWPTRELETKDMADLVSPYYRDYVLPVFVPPHTILSEGNAQTAPPDREGRLMRSEVIYVRKALLNESCVAEGILVFDSCALELDYCTTSANKETCNK